MKSIYKIGYQASISGGKKRSQVSKVIEMRGFLSETEQIEDAIISYFPGLTKNLVRTILPYMEYKFYDHEMIEKFLYMIIS